MSDQARITVIKTLTNKLRSSIKYGASVEFLNLLIDEIDKHVASLATKHKIHV